ncbi:hypothetical protein HOO54_19365 [Bacillus sp. WMMC1349]|uniref:DUF6470 family protein n=1 Tax=Bacillus sp. WMMC1349 TaxID=2736254 RepID=UPI00155736FA|nr:DUF6470 family protein [Bacillus sp. WMMC1349]NPC94318.1 hypothetical protein [Bacillus sp. WMMC1349]
MQLPRLIMESVQARIGLTTTPAKLGMEQPRADMEIEQPHAELDISVKPSKLTIDQTKAWEDLDRKHIFKRIEEAAQQGQQDCIDGIARTAEQGDELMRIENGGDPIAEQARRNSEPEPIQIGIHSSPAFSRVKIEYTPSEVDIKATPHKPVIKFTPHKPVVDYTPGSVKVDMLQYPELKINVEYPKPKQ